MMEISSLRQRGRAMINPDSKKITIIAILAILEKYSDVEHKLTAKQIIDHLSAEYGIAIDRKAVKRNLIDLVDFGYDIEYTETTKVNPKGEKESIYTDWYINHKFDNSELRMLIDSLLFSKHIPYSQCKELIEKLCELSNTYFKNSMQHVHNLPETMPRNPELFLAIEVIDEAIRRKKQVAFNYTDFDVNKEKQLRTVTNGEPYLYEVTPYQMVATNGRYYLICGTDKHNDLGHYRVDRIANIKLLEKSKARPLKEIKGCEHGLNLPKHMAEHIYMYSGESVRVKFIAEYNAYRIMNDLVDWFGQDFTVRKIDDQFVEISLVVNEDAMVNWAMQYGSLVEVKSPKRLRDRLAYSSKKMADKYR